MYKLVALQKFRKYTLEMVIDSVKDRVPNFVCNSTEVGASGGHKWGKVNMLLDSVNTIEGVKLGQKVLKGDGGVVC